MNETRHPELRGHTATALFPSPGHAHRHCKADALAHAARICRQRGLRLTRLRRQALETIWESHCPIKAYELLERMGAERRLAPPSVYRTLHFLEQQGLVHRLRSNQSFIGCSHPSTTPHTGQFLICSGCGTAAELPGTRVPAEVDRAAAAAGFHIERATVEFHGRCQTCKN